MSLLFWTYIYELENSLNVYKYLIMNLVIMTIMNLINSKFKMHKF